MNTGSIYGDTPPTGVFQNISGRTEAGFEIHPNKV